MAESIFQLVYVSRSQGVADDALLSAIRASATGFNPRHDITGVLLSGGGLFMQLLEGPFQTVTALLDGRIARDPRHSDLRVIHGGYAEERLFPSWSMGVFGLEEASEHSIEIAEAIPRLVGLAGALPHDAIAGELLRSFERVVCGDSGLSSLSTPSSRVA